MDFFNYRDGQLYCEGVAAERLAAEVGTPAYVYSKATLLHHYRQIADAFSPINATVCFSIKSCGNINICRLLADAGCGFDVTSGGELFRALEAGGDPKKIIYAGVGKTDDEIRRWPSMPASRRLTSRSEAEIENIDKVAGRNGHEKPIGAIRINPDVDPKTHAKTSTGTKETKFGVDIERAERVFEQYKQSEAPAHRRRARAHRQPGVRNSAVRRRGERR